MNKKGLNEVVVTVILILLLIAAVAIIWYFVRGSVDDSINEASNTADNCVSLDLQPLSCSFTNESGESQARVVVKKNPGESDLRGIRFIFEGDAGSRSFDNDTNLSSLESKSFLFDLGEFSPVKIVVAGLVGKDNKLCNPGRYLVQCIQGVCGNNVVEGGEDCDGQGPVSCNTATSGQHSGYPGTQTCDSCHYSGTCQNTNGYYCGDGQQHGTEQCDSDDVLECKSDCHSPGSLGYNISIAEPLDGTEDTTNSFPYQRPLRFNVALGGNFVSPSNLTQAGISCFYRIKRVADGTYVDYPIASCDSASTSMEFINPGDYDITVYLIDGEGNLAREDISMSVDVGVNILYPLPASTVGNFITQLNNIDLRFIPNLQFPQSCYYTINSGPNVTVSPCTGQTNILTFDVPAEGAYTVSVFASDQSGVYSGTRNFVVDFCPADLNGDQNRNFGDLNLITTNFGCEGVCQGDVNLDNRVDATDLAILNSVYNTQC